MSEVLWRRLGYMLSPQLDIYQAIAECLGEEDAVMDIGFGTGFGTLQLTKTADMVVGVENDKEAVDFANKCLPGIMWYWGDVSRGFDYVGGEYDAIVMIEVLEHVADWRSAIRNVYKMLAPGGTFYISARNANADLRKNELHEREWTAAQLHSSMREYFEDVKLYDYRLEKRQELDTRQTPLLAVCRKGE